jgi:hypothetical protein
LYVIGFFLNSLGVFLEDFFLEGFFDEIFWVEVFGRNFLGGFLWEDFFEGIQQKVI